jgi:hypothetical protein
LKMYERPAVDVYSPMSETIWLASVVVGCTGGALNAVLSDCAHVLPSLVTLSPGQTRIVRVGLLGSIAVGAAAVVFLSYVFEFAGARFTATSGFGLVLLGICDLFIAFVSARFLTNEVDKLVLRKAVFKAASAPAAHPDVVGEMEAAPPYTLYTLADRLLPGRAGAPLTPFRERRL